MRMGILLAAATLLAAPVMAADIPTDGLKGIWKIGLPASAGYNDAQFFGATGDTNAGAANTQQHVLRFGTPYQQYCRIGGGDNLQVRCISFGKADDGQVSTRGDELTLAWSADGRTRMTLAGRLKAADRLEGTCTLEDNRERHSSPDKIIGERVKLDAATDDAGLGVTLRGVLAGLSLGDSSLLVPNAPDVAAPKDLGALGRVQAVYHVGQAPLLRDPQMRPLLEVYAVTFANGERLCSIHAAHGKVDGLRCV